MIAICFMAVSAQAAPIDPDPMERYAVASPWTPVWATDGWTTIPGDATFSISATAGSTGQGIHCVNSDVSNNAFACWNASLDTAANPGQILEADFRLVAYYYPGYNSAAVWYILDDGQPTNSPPMGTGIVEFKVVNGVGQGTIWTGSVGVPVPVGSGISLGNYYHVQFQNDFTNALIRVRLGQVGGAYNNWSPWASMDHGSIQPNFVTAGFFGTADMDNFNLYSYTPAQMTPVNPDDFERYTETSNWNPSSTAEGWTVDTPGGGYYILSRPSPPGPAGHGKYLEMDAYNPNLPEVDASWYMSLSKTQYSLQQYSGVFSIQSYQAANNPYQGFYVQPMSSSGNKYPGVLEFTVQNGGRIMGTGGTWTTLPGGSPAIYPSFYTYEWQINYSTGQQRACFGPYGGAMNAWTPWVNINNPDQLGKVVFGCYSYFDLDDVAITQATPDPGSIAGQITLQGRTIDLDLTPVRVQVIQNGQVLLTETVSPGAYSIANLQPGLYDVAFKACAWLRTLITGVNVTSDGVAPCNPVLLGGDLDGDNEVTSTDLSSVLMNLDAQGAQGN